MTDLPAVPVDMGDAEVARLFEQLNLLTAPVVDAAADCSAGSRSTTSSTSSATRAIAPS